MKPNPSLFGGLVLAGCGTTALAQLSPTPPMPAAAPAKPALTPAASAALTTLQRVCVPLLSGVNPRAVARAAGVKIKDDAWTLPIEGKQRVDIDVPGGSNPHLCSATITFSGTGVAISSAINAWALRQTPPLAPIKVAEKATGPSHIRTTSTWEGASPKGSEAIVLSLEKTLQGQPVAGDLDQAELLLTLTPS